MTPSAWMTTTVGGLSAVARGASPRPIASPRWFDNDGEVRWIRIADVNRSDGRTLRETTQALSADGIARSRYLEPGTLIMSIAATVGIPVITGVPSCIHDGFVALEDLKADKRFMLYLLKASEARLREAGQSGSQMNVNSEIVRGLQVTVPSDREEQIRISSALWETDELIDALERAIAKKRAIKQGMMQELLTGRTRLPGFSGEWSKRTIGEIANVVMGQSPSGKSYNARGIGTPLIQGNADIRDRRTVDRVWTTQPAKRVRAGEVVLTVRAPVGYTAIATKDACLGRGVCGISAGKSTQFLFHALVAAEPTWALLEQGSTFTSVNSAQVRAFELDWPQDDDEAAAISAVLNDVDFEIDALERRLESTRAIKQGMMQELLTGRTRLLVAEEVSV